MGNMHVSEARYRFFEAIGSEGSSRHAMERLRDDVWPLYREVLERVAGMRLPDEGVENTDSPAELLSVVIPAGFSLNRLLSTPGALTRPLSEALPVKKSLSAWLAANNLDCDWCREESLLRLMAWCADGELRDRLAGPDCASTVVVSPDRVPGVAFAMDFAADGWIKGFEPWSDFEQARMGEFLAEARSRFQDYLRGAYRAQIKALPEACQAFIRGLEKDRAGAKRAPDHVKWLARFQVGGERFSQIAADVSSRHGSSYPTVRDAVRSTAAYIGLSLRPPRAQSSV